MIMCFTGRRPKDLLGYEHAAYLPMVEAIKSCLREHIVNGYDTFISGGAQGFDQLAFWAVNRLKSEFPHIKNITCIPFEGQERIWKPEGLFSQKEYRLMNKLADKVIVVTPGKVEHKRDVVNALYERNHAMVEAADAVFGLFPDDSWKNPTTKGGTAECLRNAYEVGKAIYQLSNTTLQGKWVNTYLAENLPLSFTDHAEVYERVFKGLSAEFVAYSYGHNGKDDIYRAIGKRGMRVTVIVDAEGLRINLYRNGSHYAEWWDGCWEDLADDLDWVSNDIKEFVEDTYNDTLDG